MKQETDSLKSVHKALRILMCFQAERPTWGVRELAAHLGYSPATVLRLLKTLMAYSFIDQDAQTRQYRLGNVYFQFVQVLGSTYPVINAAKPFLKALLTKTQETVHLNLIDGVHRVCIDSIESPQSLKGSMPVGEKSPLYAGASARCLLAFSSPNFVDDYLNNAQIRPLTANTLIDSNSIRQALARCRKRGFAESLSERTPGLASLSAPIFDHSGSLLASVSLAIPELRYRDKRHRMYCLQALLEASAALSRAMGFGGSYQGLASGGMIDEA